MFVLFVLWCSSYCLALLDVNFTTSKSRDIIDCYTNEFTLYPYTFVTSHLVSDPYTYNVQGILPFASQVYFTLTTRDGIKHANIVQSGSTLIAVHNNVFEIYDVENEMVATRSTEQEFDSDSDIAIVHNNNKDYLFLCSNKLIGMYNLSVNLIKSTNFPCDFALSGGVGMLASKYNGQVTIYSVSERLNRLQVNSPNDFYKNGETLTIPFYDDLNAELYNPQYSQMINTYGSLVIVGTPFKSVSNKANVGGVILYYDYYLTQEAIRFKILWKYDGTVENGYTGWSVGVRSGYVFIGGAVDTNSSGIVISEVMKNLTKEMQGYCVGQECSCPKNYIFINGDCFVSLNSRQMILTLLCVFLSILIFILMMSILFDGYNKALFETGISTDTFTISPSEVIVTGRVCEQTTFDIVVTNRQQTNLRLNVSSEKCCAEVQTNELLVLPYKTEEYQISLTPLASRSTIDVVISDGDDYINLPVIINCEGEQTIYCGDDLCIIGETELSSIRQPPLQHNLSKKLIQRLEFACTSSHLLKIEKCCIHPTLLLMTKKYHTLSSQDNILECIRSAALGLQDLHNASFVHGNITLDSLVVDTEGNGYLSDYWIPTQPMASAYTAPEILKGEQPSFESDIYSFAVAIIISCGGSIGNDSTSVVIKGEVKQWEVLIKKMITQTNRPSISEVIQGMK
ncbi:Protein kinase domain-containing protein [Entamoeba marina]